MSFLVDTGTDLWVYPQNKIYAGLRSTMNIFDETRRENIRHGVEYHIKTTPGPAACRKPRHFAPDRSKPVKTEFELMMEQGVIRSSKSPWASPLHVVSKKHRGLQHCSEYRALNSRTVTDRYSQSHIEDFAQHLYDNHQIPIAPEDVEETAIATPFGFFKIVNIMFRLRNAAQTCQQFVDEITRSLDFVYSYIDDFLIASQDEQRHREHLRTLFERLNDYGVVINLAKCEFGGNAWK
jgi:hypothetical protein